MKPEELKLCGLPAVQARWKKDPSSFLRLFYDQKLGRSLGNICKELAATRRVYRSVDALELERIAGSHHHGGVVAVVSAEQARVPTAEDVAGWVRVGEPLLVLDRIGNPHNLGALARTAAFLGVKQIVITDAPGASRGNDAAYRVSEGGLEAANLWAVSEMGLFLRRLSKAGYQVVGAATRGGEILRPGGPKAGGAKAGASTGKPAATAGKVPLALRAPVALVLGNEEHGMAPDVAAACTRLVTLAGGGEVESLNVSVAGALLMWELLAPKGV